MLAPTDGEGAKMSWRFKRTLRVGYALVAAGTALAAFAANAVA